MPDARAVLVTSSFLPGRGGIESYLAELCSVMAPSLAVLAPPQRDGKPLPSDLGYPAHPGPARMLWPGRSVARAVIETCARYDTDKVVFGTPWPLILIGPALRRAGIRYSVIVHGAELTAPGAVPILRHRVARSLSMADLLLPVSEYTARRTTALLESRGLAVPEVARLYARVDLQRFRPGLDTARVDELYGLGGRKVVLCFGRLVPRKGVDRLVRVMPEVARRVPGAVLVVAGTGPEERKLRRLAERLGAPVVFTGRVAEEDAAAVYARAGVFALAVADRWFGLEIEGLGVVLLEAAACEVPCVTGRSGGTPEAVRDGETGFVVDARDPEALTERIVTLLSDEAAARRMGRAGREHVARHFSAAEPPAALGDWVGKT